MTRAYLAFTAKGLALAEKLAAEYPGSVARCGHEPGQPGLADWTAWQFAHSDALIFVGAVEEYTTGETLALIGVVLLLVFGVFSLLKNFVL